MYDPRINHVARERSYLIALLLALVGSIGSVWLSVGMDLKACPLCFYQRSAAFLALATLLMGWVTRHFLAQRWIDGS